ncbi:MAG: dihydrodipicolinate synthase family protein [Phycisphaerae bacterium]|nr:dihydrodipicolinate synthase family protein [Phycisphaerae bacterium]
MTSTLFTGVLPAITTPFKDDDSIDPRALGHLVERMLAARCRGIITPGSLGEGSALSFDEKREIWKTCVAVADDRAPVIAAIASGSTREAAELARTAERVGCRGLMVLPPYVYRGDWTETREHMSAICAATALPLILYNNPPAYGVDLLAHHVAELAGRHANIEAVKDSSGDARRFPALKSACGDRLQLLVGMDDCVVEGVRMGATGWVAGLVNALPEESVKLFEMARAEVTAEATGADRAATERFYAWFLPLLRLDTVPKFVQLIKLVQQETRSGTERVRPPRRELVGAERATAIALIRAALAHRPTEQPVSARQSIQTHPRRAPSRRARRLP